MSKFYFCFVFLLLSIIVSATKKLKETKDLVPQTYCDGTGWVPFKDEQCYKVIKNWYSPSAAKLRCEDEYLQSDASVPALASIKSVEEQEFLINFIFNETESAVKVNVWLGANRSESGNFQWQDGTGLDGYSDWAENSPTDDTDRSCLWMTSKYMQFRKDLEISETSKDFKEIPNGKWKDVTCEGVAFVVCQKKQRWSFLKLQQAFLEARKGLSDSLDSVTAELVATKNRLVDSENEIQDLRKNPVPYGFIYVQLPAQADPRTIWPNVNWMDVTSAYAGLFFRAEGGGSVAFGSHQSENAPRVTDVQRQGPYSYTEGPGKWENITLQVGGWSSGIGVFSGTYDGFSSYTHRFYQSAGEVRPRNTAVRIWKRIY